eukprot:3605136-Pleurochrysis_carterae.AAC.1
MGAVFKQTISRDILNATILTESGYITNPKEVAEQLRCRYSTEEWSAKQVMKTVNEIVVLYANHAEVSSQSRPPIEPHFDHLVGSLSNFSFQVLAAEQIIRREGSCWCEACMRARGRMNMVSCGVELRSPGCPLASAMPWKQITVKQQQGANRRTEAQREGKKYAKQLKPSQYFAVQARAEWSSAEEVHLRPGHFWLAQAPPESEFSAEAMTRRTTMDGIAYSVGDVRVRVGRYFDREASDLSGLTFEEWTAPEGACHYINSTELRAVNFTMEVVGRALPLSQVRSRRGSRQTG